MSGKGQAEISVVVPSVNGWDDLGGCLAALQRQEGQVALEAIVVDRLGEEIRNRVRQHYPGATVIAAPPGTGIPAMRALAFGAAQAPIVGVIEDHVIVPPGWAGKMLDAHRQGAEAVGGTVANAAVGRRVDRAAFWCEYSQCLAPPPAGPAEWLTGNNVTYRRTLLERFHDVIAEGRWEDHLHRRLREAGIVLHSRPDIVVGHKKHYTAGEYVRQRYLYAKAYAGMRVAGAPAGRRFAYGLAAFVLPPLLLGRIVSRVFRTGGDRRELILSLPLLALFVTAWAAGEVAGYWRGGGDALGKVC